MIGAAKPAQLALFFGLPLGLLAACADYQMSDLVAYVEQVKARPPTNQVSQALAPVKIESFTYVAAGRRDPFMPSSLAPKTPQTINPRYQVRPDLNRRKEPLENYALSNLRMVGSMARNGVRWGLVLSQDGMVHRVNVNNYMGQNHGKVIEIQEDRINLLELVKAGDGYREQQTTLDMESL